MLASSVLGARLMGEVIEIAFFRARRSVDRALRLLDGIPETAETAERRDELIRILARAGSSLLDCAAHAPSPTVQRAAMRMADRVYTRLSDVHAAEHSA
jgi:hypothetical protein